MARHCREAPVDQSDMFETDSARSLLDQLLEDSRLYRSSKDYRDLLDFVVQLRNFAPFNAMLLQVQKPGLRYAASARDWRERFGRDVKEKARPRLILWPFGPVALVYDVVDTDGKPLPEDVAAFSARGAVSAARIADFARLLTRSGIECLESDEGDNHAGCIRVVYRTASAKERSWYRMFFNQNHAPPVQFATIAHELGHLFLGHLGEDQNRHIKGRSQLPHAQRELEAESVSYIVCCRNGVESRAQTYLTDYVQANTTIESLDLFEIMRAAGKVETSLGVAAQSRFDPATRPPHQAG